MLEQATPAIGDLQATFESLVALDTDIAGLIMLKQKNGTPFGPHLTRLLDRRWSVEEFGAAIIARKRAVNVMAAFMADWDLLLTPATACPAFPIELDHPTVIAGRIVGHQDLRRSRPLPT